LCQLWRWYGQWRRLSSAPKNDPLSGLVGSFYSRVVANEVEDVTDPNCIDANGDDDEDDLNNFDEMCHGTDPNDSDTDNDGVSDSAEVAQGSDPTDAADEGDAANCISLTLVVGDHSASYSERYALIVGNVRHQSTNFGQVAVGDYSFVKGRSYNFRVQWVASRFTNPDLDYTARIGGLPSGSSGSEIMVGSGFSISDPQLLLGEHPDTSTEGKSGILYIGGTANTATETENPDPGEAVQGDPVNVINGNVTMVERDLVIPAPGLPLEFSRHYHSRGAADSDSAVGAGWRHSYDMGLTYRTNATYKCITGDWLVLSTPDGQRHWFLDDNGAWLSPVENNLRLVQTGAWFRVESPGGIAHTFLATHQRSRHDQTPQGTRRPVRAQTGSSAWVTRALSTAVQDNRVSGQRLPDFRGFVSVEVYVP